MALLPPNLDYTDRDRDALLLRLQALVRSVFPTWTDYNVANFGNILLELMAYVGDFLAFYQDNQARETRIISATQRRNLLALVALLGYQPAGVRAARANVTISIVDDTGNPAVPVGSVVIPPGTVISTPEITGAVEFTTLDFITFGANVSPAVQPATVENSAFQSDTFTSSGLPNQSFQLSATPYVDDSASVNDAVNDFVQVDSFLDSTPSDHHYTVTVDQNNQARITFGNGTNGSIPVGEIDAGYRTGGGAGGNVEAGKISKLEGNFTDAFGNRVNLVVTNPAKATGGLDRQSMSSIKLFAPQSVRAETRCVGSEDFEINALKVTGVGRALMLTSDDDPAIEENTGSLFIVPTTGGVMSQSLKDAVTTQITVTTPHTLTFKPSVFTAPYLVVNVFAIVFFNPGTNRQTAAAAIRANLAALFQPVNVDGTPNDGIDFGARYVDENGHSTGLFPLDDVWSAIKKTPGLRKVGGVPSDFTLNGAHADLPIAAKQFPSLGSVQIVDGDTGASL